MVASVVLKHTFRYIVNAAISAVLPITRANFLNSLILNIGGSTANWRALNAVRLTRIRAYLPAASTVFNGSVTLTSVPQITLDWASNLGSFASITESNGGSTMMRADFFPPKDSLAAFWAATGQSESEVLFYVQASVGVILDVSMNIVLNGTIEASASVGTTNAGVGGIIYNTYLDGPSGSAKLVPVGLLSLN